MRYIQWLFLWSTVVLMAGCATYPKNPHLTKHDPNFGYRFENLKAPGNSESLFVILTFSGGGTRAAALSYGVMEKLQSTKIVWEGHERKLLEEVDVISSVSGGSFTAAYYGLFGKKIFDPQMFEKLFLYRNIEADLFSSMLSPVNWIRLSSPTFSRIDLAAEFYDRNIFERKTYSDLISQDQRPFIILNATDITMGSQFTFTQDQFDLLCSDLSGVSIGRAVAASSAFPVAFPTLILNNYAGTCNYLEPPWIEMASKDLMHNPPRFNRARIARSYEDSKERPYIHLLDGGVADNIGLRKPLTAILSNDLSWSLPDKINFGKVKNLVVIVVDARTHPKQDIDKTPRSPGLQTIVDIIASVPMSNYSFETVQLLNQAFDDLNSGRKYYADCNVILENSCPGARMPLKPPNAIDLYAVYVGFDQINDKQQQEYFLNLPTTFHLDHEAVNKLRAVGAEILDHTKSFQELCHNLKCHQ